MANPPTLATPAEAAQWLKVTERQLKAWRATGAGPKVTKLGHRTIRYAGNDLIAYAVACRARTAHAT